MFTLHFIDAELKLSCISLSDCCKHDALPSEDGFIESIYPSGDGPVDILLSLCNTQLASDVVA